MKIKFLSLLKNVRFIIFMIFVVSIFVMSYGFATFKSDMRIFGLATVTKYGKVYISAVEELSHEFVNASGEDPDFNDTVATMQVNAEDVIFSATYKITITNSMNIDQVLTGVTLNTTVLSGSGTVDSYVQMTDYSTGSAFYPGDILPARSDTVLKVKIYYTADSKVTVETEFGIMAGDESTGSLSKGTISRNTGSFDDNKTPECYTVDFMNSYDFENVIGITTSSGYEILNTSGGVLGNVRVPANSTKTVTYCIRPTGIMTNSSTNLPISYKSYSTGQTFSDTIVISMTTNRRTLIVTTNFDDGIIICNNLTKGYYGIINTTKSGSAEVMIGDNVNCSVGDGNALASNKEYQYTDGQGNYAENFYDNWTITSETSSYERTINLVLKPAISLSQGNTNSENGNHLVSIAYTGTVTNKRSGYYMVELYGSDGGNGYKGNGGDRGKYGYVYGVIYLNYDDVLYYSLGGHGESGHSSKSSNTRGGANGGGNSESGYNYQGGGGGGYSILQKNNSSGDIIMVAGGAGGAGGPGGTAGAYDGGDGGNGARLGVNFYTDISNGVVIHGSNGTGGSNYGIGGSASAGYNNNRSDGGYGVTLASSFQGGRGVYRGGGGGGGYFGGGAGCQDGGTSDKKVGGGGGGSGFLAKTVNFSAGNSRFAGVNPGCNSNNDCSGGIVITYIGKTL